LNSTVLAIIMLEFLLLVSSDLQRYIEKLKHQAFSVLFLLFV